MSTSSGKNGSGGGGGSSSLSAIYNATLPTYFSGQASTLQTDANGRLIVSPFSLIFSAPLQTYGSVGVGSDTAFPSSISTTGTSLGALPTGGSRIQISIPPGASVSLYIASAVAASAAAAALVARTYSNASGNTSNLDVTFDLNGTQAWITNVVAGTSSTYISGKPIYRFL